MLPLSPDRRISPPVDAALKSGTFLSRMTVMARSGVHEDRGEHLAALAHQYVVSAAGGARIHRFAADVCFSQRARQVWTRKPLALASAEQHEFRGMCTQTVKVRGRQGVEAC